MSIEEVQVKTRLEIASEFTSIYGGKVWAKSGKVRIYRGEPNRQACLDIPANAKNMIDANIISRRTSSGWYSWESELWRDFMEFRDRHTNYLIDG